MPTHEIYEKNHKLTKFVLCILKYEKSTSSLENRKRFAQGEFFLCSVTKMYGPIFFTEKNVTGKLYLDMLQLWLLPQLSMLRDFVVAVAKKSRYRIVTDLVTSSSLIPLKIHRVEQRCTLNLSRAQTSSRWCGVVVSRGGASSGVIHVT
ncbi:uncharacterized protein TNCV_4123811 [Trichonephila clavipes]|nr:uncharacterized protein TNCV_4123811 [Trichonephila clavipes]